jgi:hypothetical protein
MHRIISGFGRASDYLRGKHMRTSFEAMVRMFVFRHGRACPGHPRLSCLSAVKTWMPGTRPGMTIKPLLHGLLFDQILRMRSSEANASAECVRRGEAAEPAGDGEELRHGFLDDVLGRLHRVDQSRRLSGQRREKARKIPGGGMSTRSAGQPCFIGSFGDCPLPPHPVVWDRATQEQ